MSNDSEAFVAFDTSKSRHAVAIAEGRRDGEVRYLGEIDNSDAAVVGLIKKVAAKYGRVTFCYEAGPTGYSLYRLISGSRSRVHGGGALIDPDEGQRSGEDQPARCSQPGQTVARRRAHPGLGSR